jgi:hypothetical protein
MKAIIRMFVEFLVPLIFKLVDEDTIRAVFREYVREWAEKHVTAEELSGEINDVAKWLKDRF